VVLEGDSVSRKHCHFEQRNAIWWAVDDNSTNGTYVNDDRMLPGNEVRLVDGDRVRLGADVAGDVSLPQAEPDPSGLSRNGLA
jgi:pSer/pThr/pTyr-binding forkhead associated (FHA) protein